MERNLLQRQQVQIKQCAITEQPKSWTQKKCNSRGQIRGRSAEEEEEDKAKKETVRKRSSEQRWQWQLSTSKGISHHRQHSTRQIFLFKSLQSAQPARIYDLSLGGTVKAKAAIAVSLCTAPQCTTTLLGGIQLRCWFLRNWRVRIQYQQQYFFTPYTHAHTHTHSQADKIN